MTLYIFYNYFNYIILFICRFDIFYNIVLHNIYIYCLFDKLNIFKFEEVEFKKITNISKKSYSFYVEYLTIPSRLFEILNNGTYVIGGYVTSTQKFHLIIYDPIKKTIIHELTFDSKVDKLLTIKNKIVFSQRHNEFEQARRFVYSNILKIMDENIM